MNISDNTIAAVARLYNKELVGLSDADVVELVKDGRAENWKSEGMSGDSD